MLADLLKPRLTEMGKIKIGGLGDAREKKGGGTYRLPRKDDHFTITTLHRDPKGSLVTDDPLMQELIGELGDSDGKLRQIPIVVMSDDPEDIMQCAYVWYAGKRVGARSDGKVVTWNIDRTTGAVLVPPLIEAWSPDMADLMQDKEHKLFKLYTTFNCVITSKDARWGGVYKLRTTSHITSEQLYGSLIHISQLTRGVLRGMPMRLIVRPMQVTPGGTPTTVHVVHCELRGADILSIQAQALTMAQAQVTQTRALEAINIQYKEILTTPGD